MVVPELSRAVVVLERQLDLHLVVRLVVVSDLPLALARKTMLWKRAGVRELRKHHWYPAPDRIAGSERRGLAHEQHIDTAGRNPGRGVSAIQVDLGGAAGRVGQHHLGHPVFATFNACRHGTNAAVVPADSRS